MAKASYQSSACKARPAALQKLFSRKGENCRGSLCAAAAAETLTGTFLQPPRLALGCHMPSSQLAAQFQTPRVPFPLTEGGAEKPLLQDSPTLVFPKSGSVIPKLWSDGGGGKAPEIPHEEGLQTQPRELQGGKSSLSQEGVRRCSWSSELVEKPHGREKAHKCLECGKGFSRSSTLMEHQNIHIGERSCECGECGKSFSGSSDLTKDHKIHTGKRWNSEIVTHHAWNVRRASGGIQRSSLTSTSTPGRGPASVPSVGRASCAAPAPSPMGGSALDDPQ
uniref:C2H2-type domain-containing protein n=1 Tax=Serinus canaria TaxID=9135 RepID=A0A8C9MGU8_SERCA